MMSEGHRSWGNRDYNLYCLCFCSANSTCPWTSVILAWVNRPRPVSWGYSAATRSSIFQPLFDKELWDLDNVNKAWGQRFVVQEPTENSLTPPPSTSGSEGRALRVFPSCGFDVCSGAEPRGSSWREGHVCYLLPSILHGCLLHSASQWPVWATAGGALRGRAPSYHFPFSLSVILPLFLPSESIPFSLLISF